MSKLTLQDADNQVAYGFDTWTQLLQFAEPQARRENSEHTGARCHTCLDNGCGEPDGDGITCPKVSMCDGDCGDGCKRARPVDTPMGSTEMKLLCWLLGHDWFHIPLSDYVDCRRCGELKQRR